MKRYATAFVLLLNVVAAQVAPGNPTPYDEPVLEAVASPERILNAVATAKEQIFLVVPGLDSQTLLEALGEQARRIPVYVVMSSDQDDMAADLAEYGAQVRLIPNTAEGLILIDYQRLYVGGLISGTVAQTQYVDLGAYGNSTMVNQLRGLWQAATPYGDAQ